MQEITRVGVDQVGALPATVHVGVAGAAAQPFANGEVGFRERRPRHAENDPRKTSYKFQVPSFKPESGLKCAACRLKLAVSPHQPSRALLSSTNRRPWSSAKPGRGKSYKTGREPAEMSPR